MDLIVDFMWIIVLLVGLIAYCILITKDAIKRFHTEKRIRQFLDVDMDFYYH